MRLLILLLALAACRPDARSAEDLLVAARDAADAAEVSEAMQLYEKAAAKGSTDAMFRLEGAYRHGTVHTRDGWVAGMVRKDDGKAERYRTQALDSLVARADRGDADAWARWIAATWSERSDSQNAAHFQQAAAAGSPVAMGLSALGFVLTPHRAPATDSLFFARAHEAAAAGDALGESLLALAYREGIGVEVDADQHRSWLAKAAASGDEPARRELAALERR